MDENDYHILQLKSQIQIDENIMLCMLVTGVKREDDFSSRGKEKA